MNRDWRQRKLAFRVPSNSIPGVAVLGGVAIVVAVLILAKGEKDNAAEVSRSVQNVRVIDGDTIEINSEKIRLSGIDAPEKGQPCSRNNAPYDCGTASKEHLEFLLTGASIECTKKGKDKWGRHIAECASEGESINQLMVRHGWAIAYREYSTEYVEDEMFAKSNRLGMWSKEFLIPSDWRKSDRGDKL